MHTACAKGFGDVSEFEAESPAHWACLLLIEYAWLLLPGAVGDEENENVNVTAVVDSRRPLRFVYSGRKDDTKENTLLFSVNCPTRAGS